MTVVSSGARADWPLPRAFDLGCIALSIGQAVYLAASLVQGQWLADPSGQPIATDFINVWAAGRQALAGEPATVYDVALHKAAEVTAVGHAFEGEYPWLYPPTFLFVAVSLALLPYAMAAAVWLAFTFSAYLIVVPGIIRHRAGILLACAYPGLLANAVVAQNGFLSAALLGGALLLLPASPITAGCLIGLLAFKPHLGILLPVVLIAGGYWRAVAAATATLALLALSSWAAFGPDAWTAFFQSLPMASQSTLEQGRAEWGKLQSAYGVVRMLGGTSAVAWAVQGALTGVVAVTLATLWRSKTSFDLKAAALAVGSVMAMPYMFLYDLVLLAVAMAFLLRACGEAGPTLREMRTVAIAALLIAIFPLLKVPVGFAAAILVAFLILRRVGLVPARLCSSPSRA